jgi:hypothetical protein
LSINIHGLAHGCARVRSPLFCVEDAVSEQFSVTLFFNNNKRIQVRRFVSAQDAYNAFQHYTHSAGARLGLTVRVIIADASGCVVREWKYGQGITLDLRHRRE